MPFPFRRGIKLFDPFLWRRNRLLEPGSIQLDEMLGGSRRAIGESEVGDVPASIVQGTPNPLTLPPLGPRQAVNLERDVPVGFGPQFTSPRELGRRVPPEGAVGPEVDRFRRGNIKGLDEPGWSLEWQPRTPTLPDVFENFILIGPKGDRWFFNLSDTDGSGTWEVRIDAFTKHPRLPIGVIRQVMREVAGVVPGIVQFASLPSQSQRSMAGPLRKRMETAWRYPQPPPPGFRPPPPPTEQGPPPFGQGGYGRR